MSTGTPAATVTVATLRQFKQRGEKFSCLTVYDASFARLLDAAGIDVMLVGDSLGMVIQGRDTTIAVSMDDMVYHSACVARGRRRALVMTDMPFMSYATREGALRNAARLMQQGGAHILKLEGGARQAEVVRALADNGVPVCAHLGLRPQSVHLLGGYRVQGRGEAAARAMLDDARALEQAGAEALLLECVPVGLAAEITRNTALPVIGIGAGSEVDGQVLVLYDMLGLTSGKVPRFARNFLAGADGVDAALRAYARAVRDGSFPAPEHCFG